MATDSTTLKLLILEDEPNDAELAVRHLQKAGFTLQWQRVQTEEEYAAALKPELDLILADFNLPRFDALRALAVLRDRQLDVPLIVFSGVLGEDVAVEAMKQGAADYLLKSRVSDLPRIVARALEEKAFKQEKKKAEIAVLQSEQNLRAVLDSAGDGLTIRPAIGPFVEVNRAVCERLGYTREELLRMTSKDITAPECLDDLLAHLGSLTQKDAVLFETTHVTRDGRRIPSEVSARMVTYNGQPCILALARDITDRKRMEERLRSTNRQLLDIIDFLPDATFVVNREHKVIAWNHAIEKLTGVRKAEIIGQGDYAYALPFFGERRPLLIDHVLDSTAPDGAGYEDLQIKDGLITAQRSVPRLHGGREACLAVSTSILRGENGEVLGGIEALRDVTELRKTEQALKDSEYRHRMLVEYGPGITYAAGLDDTNTTMYISPQIESILGVTPADYLTNPDLWQKMLHPEDRDRVLAASENSRRTGEPLRIEYRMIARDGREVWIRDQAQLLNDPQGRPSVLQGVMYDITELKRAETESRRNSEHQEAINSILRAAQEDLPLPELLTHILDLILSIPWLSFEMRGAVFVADDQSSQLILKASKNMPQPALQACAHVEYGSCLCGSAAATRLPVRALPQNDRGERCHVGMAPHGHLCVPILSAGKVLGVINVYLRANQMPTARDEEFLQSTADVLAGVILRDRAQNELRQIRNAMDDSSDAILAIDARGPVIYANVAFSQLFRHTVDTLNEAGFASLFLDPVTAQEMSSAVLGGASWSGELSMKSSTGAVVPVFLRATSILNDQLEVSGMSVIITDLSERRRAEDERRRMEVQLLHAQKLESIGQLAAGIAHEINTPTQFVGDNTQFLKTAFGELLKLSALMESLIREPGKAIDESQMAELRSTWEAADVDYLKEEIPKAIDQSMEGIQRVSKIVSAMKEFSHPDIGEKVATNLNRAIETTVTVSRNEWKYVAEMKLELDPNLPVVACIPGDINQVILNLIVNAAHAIQEKLGEDSVGKGTITISTKADDGNVEIRVADTGTGIPEKYRDRMFEPFFTTKAVGKGTGQGLAIAYNVVTKKHGGIIRFETETGQGTSFIIRLPREDAKT